MPRALARLALGAVCFVSTGCQTIQTWENGCPGVYSGLRYYAERYSWLPWDGKIFFTLDLPLTTIADTLSLPVSAFAEPRRPKGGWVRGCEWAKNR